MPLDISKGGTASATAAGARLKLGLTDLATMDPANVAITGGTIAGASITGGTLSGLTSPLAIADGGTNSTTEAAARTALFGVSTTTDNAIARYDGITGSLQNSSVTIDDSGNIVTSGSITGASFTGTIDADTLDGIDSTGFATAAQGTKADNAMPKSGGTFTGGISLGSVVASTPNTLTRHLALWGTNNYGFCVTNATLNYNSDNKHDFYSASSFDARISGLGIQVGSPTGGDPGAGKVNAVDYQINGTSISSLYALLSGATFTGNVTVAPASSDARVITRKAASGSNSGILGYTGNYARWFLALGDASVESGSDTGSAAALYRYSDTGAFLGTAFSFNRSTGLGTVAGDPTTALGIATKQYVDNNYAPLTSNFSFTGAVTFGGNSTSFSGPGSGNVSIELGGHGYSNAAFIDFHSGATDVDYDSRIIASGGDGTVGHGTLTLAASHVLWGTAPTSASDLVNKTYADALPLAKSYESAQQTITAAGLLTLAHGLGARPKVIQTTIKCQTAENGYSVGDEVNVEPINNCSDGTSRANSITADATNIYYRFSSTATCYLGANKTTGATVSFTNANWKLIVRAWL